MEQLIIALTAFVGSHFLMSHPLRAPLVRLFGTNGFMIAYSLVSLLTFGWAIMAFRTVPAGAPLWEAGERIWAIGSGIMLIGSILFVGSLFGNPALPSPAATAQSKSAARGVFAITRHPMMWGFALWALTHVLVSPQPKVVALTAAIGILALGGSLGQDKKKATLMGDSWRDWESRTRFLPFAGQLSGKINWAAAVPNRTILLGGIALWLIATRAHPMLGAPIAGIWRWMG